MCIALLFSEDDFVLYILTMVQGENLFAVEKNVCFRDPASAITPASHPLREIVRATVISFAYFPTSETNMPRKLYEPRKGDRISNKMHTVFFLSQGRLRIFSLHLYYPQTDYRNNKTPCRCHHILPGNLVSYQLHVRPPAHLTPDLTSTPLFKLLH
jgi:hypothetical protein